MAYVLRTWLGNRAVVTVEECNSGGAKRVHLRVDTGPRKIIIDIVCHRPAGSPDTGQSVAEHLVRVVEDYAPAHPGFEPWLVNFVTQEEEEESVANPAIRACMADPAIQACHRMHMVADGDVVLRVTVWPAGSVPSAWLPRMSPCDQPVDCTRHCGSFFVTAPVLRGGEGICMACGVVACAETGGVYRVCLRWAREDGNAASARVQWRLQKHPPY